MDKLTREQYIAAASERVDSKLRAICEAKGLRADAGEVVFTRGQLEAVEGVIYEELFSQNLEGLSFVPTRTSFDRSATTYSYHVETKTGNAILMRPDATDAPLVDSSLAKVTRELAEFGAGYKYNVTHAERAMSSFDLTASKARSCARAISQALNDHALSGSTDHSVSTGFLNDANVNLVALTTSDWNPIPTGTLQYNALNEMTNTIINQSETLHSATEILVSTYVWNLITQTRFADGTPETVIEAFRKNNPGISIRRMTTLTGAGAAGVDRCVVWERSSAVAENIIPIMYDEATPDKKGFTYSVQSRGSSFGTVVRYPLAMAYADITIT